MKLRQGVKFHDDSPWNAESAKFNIERMMTNTKKNKNLRKATAHAVDREALAKTLGLGVGRVWPFIQGEGQIGYDANAPKYEYNVAKAKQFLVDAGFPNGVDVSLTVHNRSIDQQQAQMLKQMFDAVGIRTNLNVVERIAWNSVNKAGNTEFATLQSGIHFDPDYRFGPYFTSKGSTNYGNWENADFDKCVVEGRSSYDEKQRDATYKKCYQIFYEEVPYAYNWLQVRTDLLSNKLKGTAPMWAGFFNLRAAWLDK